ncbi:MAG: division/cell wall cluster transcriptional repressor MraZ [Burkholderiales bacterium]|jgi:MraZ protein|nr:division/cell wall cluster transcriptional repressor MraZ [Burkholderiales bacterium]
MFQGAAQLSLDAKGRLAVPTKHRAALQPNPDDRVVLTAHPVRCVLLYPESVWIPRSAEVMKFSSFDPIASRWKRALIGYAAEQSLDSAGRLLVSPELRRYAGIDKQVMLIGQGTHFELWDVDAWDAQMEQLGSLPPGAPSGLEHFSL